VYTVRATATRSHTVEVNTYITTDRKNGYGLPLLYTQFRLQRITFRTHNAIR